MKQKALTQTLCAAIALLALCATAQAHQVWLEQPEGENAVIRFGEFGGNLRETSPGLLDNFGAPTAKLFTKSKAKPLTPTKTETGFTLPVRLAPGESLIAEDALFPIRVFKREGQEGRDRGGEARNARGGEGRNAGEGREARGREGRNAEGGEGREARGGGQEGGREAPKEVRNWYWPAARLITDFSAQLPSLALDIVPGEKAGAFKVTFKEKPLPRTEVQILVQSGWRKRARTDAEGKVEFDLPWQGQYVLEVSHTDRTPGERKGEKYDAINYVTTLTLMQPTGVAPLPAGPAAKPNRGK